MLDEKRILNHKDLCMYLQRKSGSVQVEKNIILDFSIKVSMKCKLLVRLIQKQCSNFKKIGSRKGELRE